MDTAALDVTLRLAGLTTLCLLLIATPLNPTTSGCTANGRL